MKTLLFTALLAAPVISTAAPDNGKISALNDQLEIMEQVIDTALKQNNTREGWRYRSLDTTYLAGQGVVFTIHVGGGTTRFFSFNSGDLSDFIQVPPIPPVPPVIIDSDNGIHVEIEQEWEEFAEETSRQFRQVFHEANAELSELRDRERELAWELRDLERRKRDLNFEQRQADNERRKEIESELKQMEREAARLADREKEIEARAQQVEEKQKARLEQQKVAQEKAYKQFLAGFEGSIGDTLCRFGAGLRELEDDEHVSFVIKDFVQKDKKAGDKVYVFSKKNIKACVQEKLDADDLLSSAESYDF